jgi:hypothetical protein
MPKYLDPVNHPKKAVNRVTINPNKVILDGGGSGTLNIYINGIVNYVIATYAGASYTTTATNWVAANYEYYRARGYEVSNTSSGSASATIIVTPRYEWDTVNRINVTAPTIDTLSATFAGTFVPDLRVAKTWEVTLGCSITVNYPKNADEGDRIRIEFYNPSSYTVSWAVLGFFFLGGTEPTITTTGYSAFEGVINQGFYPRRDVITLTGTSGTATVTAFGLAKLATFAAGGSTDLDQTGEDFDASWHDYYLAIGVLLTEAAGVMTFTATTRAANFLPPTRIANVTGNLSGTIVATQEGRVLCNYVQLDLKQ